MECAEAFEGGARGCGAVLFGVAATSACGRRITAAPLFALLLLLSLRAAPAAEPHFRFDRMNGGEEGHYVRIEGNLIVNEDTLRTARETDTHSTGTPEWLNPPGFEKDVFTFARLIFQSSGHALWSLGRGPRLGWWVDYPDADLNFSHRLQQLTSIRTDPDCRVLRITDPDLPRFPLLYMEHAGYLALRDEEVEVLRKYLRGGGAMFINDFWGQEEWDNFAAQMKRVVPERSWTELTAEHPIFHTIYDLRGQIREWQVPTIQFWNEDQDPKDPSSPLQLIYRGEGFETMHIQAMFDDHQRLLILAIHNSDVSDGWERESENENYFNKFSERIAYPLGINIVVYLMTH